MTLGFLAFQMRGNTNAVQAQTYQALMRKLNDYRTLLADPERIMLGEKRREEGWQNLKSLKQRQIRVPSMIRWGDSSADLTRIRNEGGGHEATPLSPSSDDRRDVYNPKA